MANPSDMYLDDDPMPLDAEQKTLLEQLEAAATDEELGNVYTATDIDLERLVDIDLWCDGKLAEVQVYYDRASSVKTRLENRKKRLRAYLLWLFQHRIEATTVRTALGTVTRKPTPPHVEIDNIDLVPLEYLQIVQKAKMDDLKKALLAGPVAGAHLESGETITIR